MFFIIWCLVWALSNAPDIFNHNGNDTAWLVTLMLAMIISFSNWLA